MKKKIIVLFLGLMLVSLQPLAVMAETNETAKTEESTEENTDDSVKTATQVMALEDEKDVDADIREEIESTIPEEKEEIIISSTEDFLKFAENCKLDTWSVNKIVKLTSDISLLGYKFSGISTFGGEFEGYGHTISNLSLSGNTSYCALFSTLQKTGSISNLNIKGNVIPSEEQIYIGGIVSENYGRIRHCDYIGVVSGSDYVGGIAASNKLSGSIEYCSFDGYVRGVHFTGGIAGENLGNISNCTNKAAINTTNKDTQISVDGMSDLNKIISFVKNLKTSEETASADTTVTDIGGIAGNSIGIISKCINTGAVGYDHVGYNIGGISGRQSGYIYKCTNNGKIRGRKDVGGIVGQAEPYITVDLSTDIAYQLTEAIGKLRDNVRDTLRDTKNQSGVISNRLSVIQKFTDLALDDVKFLASGTIDYANGVSGAATEAFSRVDYLMEETSKKNGTLDYTQRAMGDFGDSADSLQDALESLDIENYLSGDELQQYRDAKKTLESAVAQYTELAEKSFDPYYNYYVYEGKKEAGRDDFDYILDATGEKADYTSWSEAQSVIKSNIENGTGPAAKGKWKYSDGKSFPDDEKEEDALIVAAASLNALTAARSYAKDNYQSPIYGYSYEEDLKIALEVIGTIAEKYLPIMADDVRTDAIMAMDSIEGAADNLEMAGGALRSTLGNLASREDIVFPQFSQEYKTHTASLVDNMKGMNDNFGLLNNEMNNATGVLVDDLLAISDQFSDIMLLFTDAIDGVLDKDYTEKYEDISLSEAETTIDATIDECVNYGTVVCDISAAGIVGDMGIEYDFDLESDITGIKDKFINISYITKCVIRNCRNCNDIVSEKNYAGGICGLQELGTINKSANIGNVTSRSGGYVGGVAGRSISYIINSRACGILDGASFVGGVVGDGKHIRDCMTLVKIDNSGTWYGAIAGHVHEDGVVRDNYFISEELAGIDRVSYAKKAEPLNYGSENMPDEFKNMTISYILEDESLDGGRQLIQKTSVGYNTTITEDSFPEVESKKGYYVVWNTSEIDNIKTDKTIKAKYVKYRTTLAEAAEEGERTLHQQEILVDGEFKETDELIVERDRKYTLATISKDISEFKDLRDYETINLKIPDDGNATHKIRFKPNTSISDIFKNVDVYLVEGGKSVLLEKTGTLGKYNTYEVPGNDVTLDIKFNNAEKELYKIYGIVIGVVILVLILIIVFIVQATRYGKRLPKFFRRIKTDVTHKIETKEQLFYDDSKEEKKEKKEEKKKK